MPTGYDADFSPADIDKRRGAAAGGGIWFTDPAYGREPAELEIGQEAVYWVSPDRKTVTRVADELRRP